MRERELTPHDIKQLLLTEKDLKEYEDDYLMEETHEKKRDERESNTAKALQGNTQNRIKVMPPRKMHSRFIQRR
jgi:hypothetical protein